MIDLKTVEKIHSILIGRFGGSLGIRDLGALESALARPFATFDKIDLYPNPIGYRQSSNPPSLGHEHVREYIVQGTGNLYFRIAEA